MLWVATAVVLALAILPLYADALVGMVAEPACCSTPATETQIAQQSAPAQAGKSLPQRSETQTAALTVLSDDVHELKEAFNSDKDAVRVVLLVSPRCPMCQAGARLVQRQALAQIDSDKLRIYVVWIKRFFGDSRDAAEKAMALVPDKRARHFWDGNDQLPKRYGKILDLPGSRDFAWDVYFVFNPKAAWGETPPTPDFWMHQLGGSETGNRLDGETFRNAIRERVPK